MSNVICIHRARTRSASRVWETRIGSALIALVLICSLLGLSNTNALAAGSTYYVDVTNPACTDAFTNPGTSASLPLCTIGRAASLATVAGSTVNVLGGTYAETVFPASGTAGNPITFHGQGGATVTGNPTPPVGGGQGFAMGNKSYIVIDGFKITGTKGQGILADSSNNITISNNHVSYAGANAGAESHQEGIILKATSSSIITGNTVDNNSCVGIRVNRNSTGITISNNLVHSNSSYIAYPVVVVTDAAGIELDDSNNNTIIHNITYGNEDTGINLYKGGLATGSSSNLVVGNLSYGNGDHGIDNNTSPNNTIVGNTVQGNVTAGINFEAGSSGSTLANNILVDNGLNPGPGRKAYNLYVDTTSVSGLTANYNLYWINSGTFQINWNGNNYASLAAFRAAVPSQEANGLQGDPVFKAAAPAATGNQQASDVPGDYHIMGSSPAIDSANSNATGESSTDIEGNSRADDPATANTGSGSRTYDDRGAYEFQPAPTLPVITTQAVSSISANAAVGNGTITSLGFPNPTQHGVVWNTTGSPDVDDSKSADGPVSVTGPFTTNMTGLVSGTLYYVRAYATNTAGTAYGGEVTFTAGPAPVVTTQAVTNITTTTATGNGNVTTLGVPNPTQHGVAWGTAANPTIAGSHTSDGAVSATGPFTSSITGLTPGTVYHVRAYATNTIGTSYGSDVTFTALKQPTVTTQAVTGITAITATGNGNITDLGIPNPTDYGVVWGLGLNPTLADNKTSEGPASATGAFTSVMTGLTPGTLYHVRAYATNSVATVYGGDVIFTSYVLPVVTTQAVTNIGTTTATGNGNITTLGVPNPTQHGMVWNTSPNPTVANSHTSDGAVSATGAFTSNMTGLAQGTLYYVKAYVTSDAGTVYGSEVTFTTASSTTTTTPNTNGGTGSNVTGTGTVAWTHPEYITADDSNYATAVLGIGQTSNYLEGTNYGFAIPSNASIAGITVRISRQSSLNTGGRSVEDATVSLLKAGSLVGTNKGTTSGWPTSMGVATYGSTADLWGATWTPADINAATFGVALSAHNQSTASSRTASVDYMQIAVSYTVTKYGTSTAVNCGAGTPITTYGSSISCVATVTRAGGSAAPSGNVNWTTGGSGSFVTSPCVLSGSGGSTTCSVTYTASSVGTGSHLITATYAGDSGFFTSNANQAVTVNVAGLAPVITVGSKIYDGTTAATILTRNLTGIIGTDVVTLNGGTATFDTKNAGTGKTVTGTGFSLSGAQAGNYVLSPASATATADITAKGLTVSGLTANNKIYDRTTTATLNTASATLVGVVDSDPVSLDPSGASAVFADKNVGTGKAVTISGLTLSGTASGNYSLTQPAATADITAKGLTVSGITASNKVYDATPSATLNTGTAALVGVVSGDAVTLDKTGAAGLFINKNVGTGKTVNVSGLLLGGADSTNYSLTQPTTTANITAAGLTITGATAQDKVYDGTVSATLNKASAVLNGAVLGDAVTLNSASASGSFADKKVGTGKTVTATGFGLLGTDAGNYSLAQPSGLTANITAAGLTITGVTAQNKVYDRSTTATLSGTAALSGVVSGDTVNLVGPASASFADKAVGSGKPVTVLGYTISGTDAPNYTLAQPSGLTANITAKGLTITGLSALDKVYDRLTNATLSGTAALSGVISGDTVNLAGPASASFANKAVGSNKPVTVLGYAISGTDAGNYSLAQPTGLTANITAAGLTITGMTAQNKPYDGTATATLTGTPALSGVIPTDTVNLGGSASANFANKAVGSNKPVTVLGYTISGADSGNYSLAQPSGLTANITALDLHATATAEDKPYDGTTAAVAHIGTDKLSGDTVLGSYTAANFADKNVGAGKTVSVSGIALSGADAGNYHLVNTTATATAAINPVKLTITAISANKRLGTTRSFAGTEFTAATLLDGDTVSSVTLTSAGAPASALEGDYPIEVSAAVGTGLGNYTIEYVNGTLHVTAVNTAPVITEGATKAVTMSVNGKPTAFALTLHATDADLDILTWSISVKASHGVASLPVVKTGNAMVIGYKPTKNYIGADTFTLTVNDGFGGTTNIKINVTIKPISLTLMSNGTYDGWVLESSETSNAGGTMNSASTMFNLGDDATKKQYRAILSFDTRLPAGAVITQMTIKVKRYGNPLPVGSNPFAILGNILVDIQKGTFGSAALEVGDFQAPATKAGVAAIKNTPLTGGWYSVNVSGAIANASVNRLGTTQIRLRFATDDNNNLVANLLKFYSGNATAANRPVLVIQYYVPLP